MEISRTNGTSYECQHRTKGTSHECQYSTKLIKCFARTSRCLVFSLPTVHLVRSYSHTYLFSFRLKWKRTTAKCLNPCALLISKLVLALMKTIVVRVISLQCKGSLSENVETVRMHTGKLKSS